MPGRKFKAIAMAALIVGAAGVAIMLRPGEAQTEIDAAEASPKTPAAYELAPAEVAVARTEVLKEAVSVSAELRPARSVTLRSKVAGTVDEASVLSGQAVRAGDVLVRLDAEDLASAATQRQSSLDATRAQLALAEQALAKTEELARKGYASRSALEKAQSEAAALRANVEGLVAQADTARWAVSDAEAVAPFDGVVASRSVEPGETVGSGAELVRVVDVSSLEATVLVPTVSISRVEVGQAAELRVDGVDGPVIGAVERISPMADEGSRLVPVHVRLDNDDGRLWGGMFAVGEIVIRTAEALALPSTAIRSDGDGPYVLKLVGGALVRQDVVPGPKWERGRKVEIVEGLSEGDEVLAASYEGLVDGTLVAVTGR